MKILIRQIGLFLNEYLKKIILKESNLMQRENTH